MSIEEIIRTEMRNALNPVLQANGEMRKEIQELKSIIAKKEDKPMSRLDAIAFLDTSETTFDKYKHHVKPAVIIGKKMLYWKSDVLEIGTYIKREKYA